MLWEQYWGYIQFRDNTKLPYAVHIHNLYGKKQLTMQHIAGHQHWSSLTLFTHLKTKICLTTFSDDTKSLLQVSRQTNAKWHMLILTLSKANFSWEVCIPPPPQSISEFTDKVSGGGKDPKTKNPKQTNKQTKKNPKPTKQKNQNQQTTPQRSPQFHYVIFLLNYFGFVFIYILLFFKQRHWITAVRSGKHPRLSQEKYIPCLISPPKSVMVRALSYNEHIFKLISLWRVLGEHKARHPHEIVRSSKAMLTQEFWVLIALTVLLLTSILLWVLIEKVVSSLPRGMNISISILYWISTGTAKTEHRFLLCHTWISSFKNTAFQYQIHLLAPFANTTFHC